jgi:hypothetical protein
MAGQVKKIGGIWPNPRTAHARTAFDRGVDDRQRAHDVEIVGWLEAESDQLQEASIDHAALIEGRATVADV